MHRRQSLRPRQLDVHSRIRLVRSDADIDVDSEEQDGAASAPSITSFQELTEMADDQPAKIKRKKNIPIPVNKLVPNYEKDVLPDFHLPTSYIKLSLNFQTSSSSSAAPVSAPSNAATATSAGEKVEVDLEVEDLAWLREHPRYGEAADPRYQLTPDTFAKMLDLLEKASALINPGVITLAEADEIFSKQIHVVKSPCHKVSTDVYNYWVAKRMALKRPLLRKYWPQTPLNDTNPHLVFRPREKERYKLRKHRKNDMEGLRKLQQLRHDFDRVRHLLDLVRRREKYKRLLVDFLDETRRQQVHDCLQAALPSLPPRQPKIPSEDDIKPRKKKKKNKNLHSDQQLPSSLLEVSQPALAFTDVQRVKVPTFLEKPMARPHDLPIYVASYPPSSTELYAAIFQDPPVFRGRWRKGRGGRLIMDRVPLYGSSREVQAPPFLVDDSVHAGTALAPKKTLCRAAVAAICSMSDSEDELVDMTGAPDEDKSRPTKYVLAV
ncbi:hypothetical protein, variant 1 [Aphanomyces invadans]|uniref:Enhancer of polycomb-like protein n=2 Tax=Aphanomyces invadans TaxID=157072 RepID=A0A024TIP9_9STRA|nr:hypothetical protein, variant 1 [Aphanomyces invadans]ETV93864.1 hypothetical protein, variant 1 [Aphanomyces invadans]|eukprot:XP_008877424.1 hypothetical protein, variant 1 [Aphanomyces invadans]